jgi:hypothetical protein
MDPCVREGWEPAVCSSKDSMLSLLLAVSMHNGWMFLLDCLSAAQDTLRARRTFLQLLPYFFFLKIVA